MIENQNTTAMDGKSHDITNQKIEELKALFPDVFSEGKIDIDRLKAALGENVFVHGEHYELSWAGKTEARKEIQKQTTATLIPDREGSIDFDNAQNIFIEGENLEVLRALQKAYFGKVKMIYIDPPYNTGNDSFVYPDDYTERREEYNKRTGITDDEGYLNKQDLWKKNSRENGQFHSVWLSMMYPRLYLARNLMREDGVIFVSIGADEQANLKLLMDDIFGEENGIECISWNKRIPKNDKGIGNIHEYILVYAKNAALKHQFLVEKEGLEEIDELLQKLKNKRIEISEAEEKIKKLYDKKGYDRGITLYNSLNSNYELWGKINMSWPNANTFGPRYEVKHPKTKKPVKIPDRGWRWKEETFNEAAGIINGEYSKIIQLHDGSFMCNRIWFDNNEHTQPSSITYLNEVDNFLLRSILSLKSDGGIEVEQLFEGKSYFTYPKPTKLIETLIKSICKDKSDIVLDFFAGSGTTAQSTLELNEYGGGCRRFILVQMPEPLEEESEAKKAGYNTIADVSKTRIKKVIEKLQKERAGKLEFGNNEKQHLGFKAYKIVPSNFKVWRNDVAGDEAIIKQLEAFTQAEKQGSAHENMLHELILKSGLPLTVSIEKMQAALDTVYNVDNNRLFIFFDKLTPEFTAMCLALQPKKVICLNSCFDKDEDLTNFKLQLKDAGIELSII